LISFALLRFVQTGTAVSLTICIQ